MTAFGYKSKKIGGLVGTKFEYLEDFTLGIEASSFIEDISTSASASARQKNQEGHYWDTFLNIDLKTTLLLILTGAVTIFPLFFFNLGIKFIVHLCNWSSALHITRVVWIADNSIAQYRNQDNFKSGRLSKNFSIPE